MMKVVKRKSDGAFVYRSEPTFEKGFGIKNGVAMFGGEAEDYEEVSITQAAWDANTYVQAQVEAAAVAAEIDRYNRAEAKKRLGLSVEGG